MSAGSAPEQTSTPQSILDQSTNAEEYNPELQIALSLIRQKETEITQLIAQKSSAQRQLTISTVAIEALNDDLTDSYNERKRLESEIENNVREITDLQTKIAQLGREMGVLQDQLRAQIQTSSAQIELLNEERSQIKSLYDQAVQDYTASNQTVAKLQSINSEAAAAFEAEKRAMQEHLDELVKRYNEKSQIVAEIENSSAGRQYTVFAFIDAKTWNTDGILRVLSVTPDLRGVLLTNYTEKTLHSAWVTHPDGSIVSLAGGRPLYLSNDSCLMPTISASKSPWTLVPKETKYMYDVKSTECLKFLESNDGVKVAIGGGISEGFFMIPIGSMSAD